MLELWFDFSCPYAYLASRRARHLGVEVDWRPMLLGGVFRGIGAGDGPMATISPQKLAHNVHDMHRWADIFGEP
ncbi:MAG TPA: DsbA family protein, partial [Kofleriaceae bacterium]|nr:DsbA family protein [Kofleriaceae bacterium]